MGKIIGSVLAGYVIMFAAVFALMTGAWFALGAGGAFEAGTWNVSGAWMLTSVAVGLVAAILGGYGCAAIARDRRGPVWLSVLVLVLGVLFAIPALTGAGAGVAEPRPEIVSMVDAMSNAVQPGWLALLNPVLGVVGVMIGARLKGDGTA